MLHNRKLSRSVGRVGHRALADCEPIMESKSTEECFRECESKGWLEPHAPNDPAYWPEAPVAVARRGYGYDGKGAAGDAMASLPDVKTWHGNEHQLTDTATMEPEAAVRAIRRDAGLDWNATALPIGALVNGMARRIPGSAIVRSDTGSVLGVVGPDYSLLQPESVVETAHALAQELGSVVGAAGSFAGGRDVWCLIRGKYDPQGPMGPGALHLLLHNGNDGGSAFSLTPTSVLVCCQNTLALALAGREGLKVRHVGPVKERVEILCSAAVRGIDKARDILRMVEAHDVLVDLRADELADYACFALTGGLSRGACEPYRRGAMARENLLEGRSSVAKVVQVASWVGSHGPRATPRSLLMGAHRAAVNGMIGRVLAMDAEAGAGSVLAFRDAYARAEREGAMN